VRDSLALRGGLCRPFDSTFFIAALSSICSAGGRFSFALSASSVFNRLAWGNVLPEYFAFQA
jgi:hypothetical protein